jgi:NADH dehydrogenase FAD-containing subunit
MRRVLLIGAGHAHLGVAAAVAAFARRGAELVVVAPGDFHYSGLATGVLGGAYPPELDVVDVEALVAPGGGRFVRDVVTRLDVPSRRAWLASGGHLDWDACSLDVGSEVALAAVPGAARHAVPAKPIEGLLVLRATLRERIRRGEVPRVVVAGGGPTGVELAANLAALARRTGGGIAVTLVTGTPGLLPELPRGARDRAARVLARAGVATVGGVGVAAVAAAAVTLDDGRVLPADVVLLATGLVPAPLARDSGLPVDAAGALRVDAHLRVPGNPQVHGAGDAVAVAGHALPRIGVYAVRQAPVLRHNLLAALDGTPPRRFVPQRRALLVLNCGDGTGLATWGGWWWHGRAAWWLKDRIDRRWLARWRPR